MYANQVWIFIFWLWLWLWGVTGFHCGCTGHCFPLSPLWSYAASPALIFAPSYLLGSLYELSMNELHSICCCLYILRDSVSGLVICCWPLLPQSFFNSDPAGPITIFLFHNFESWKSTHKCLHEHAATYLRLWAGPSQHDGVTVWAGTSPPANLSVLVWACSSLSYSVSVWVGCSQPSSAAVWSDIVFLLHVYIDFCFQLIF